jgi:hypothetical protein
MSDYKNEYQKYADDAVRGREKEEAFGRLRFSLFIALAGPIAIFLLRITKVEPQKWMIMGIAAAAPLAVVLLIINFIRIPNIHKASPQALLISLVTLIGAGANIALLKALDLFQIISG